MDSLANRLGRVRRIASSMSAATKSVDEVLSAVRELLAAAGVRYLIVGGLAVVHHGYVRTTEGIELLVERDVWSRLTPLLAPSGFERIGTTDRVRHLASGVRVDLLVEGTTIPRPHAAPFPAPERARSSAADASVADLPLLVELKLRAQRHQDLADIVALVKHVDDATYLALEAAIARELRSSLARLREDALEELRYEHDT